MSHPKFVEDFLEMIKWAEDIRKDNEAQRQKIRTLKTRLGVYGDNGLETPNLCKGKSILQCSNGLYRVHWVSGQKQLAAIGDASDGRKWISFTNMDEESKFLEDYVKLIICIERLA